MVLNRLFDAVEQIQSTANWISVFGEPQTVEGKTVIPLAAVRYRFRLGFHQPVGEAGHTEGETGRAGGGITARPLGVLEVTPEGVRPIPVEDPTRVGLAGIALAGWLGFWSLRTLGKVLGRAKR
jgi:uncharacterized spore protein YtfJ